MRRITTWLFLAAVIVMLAMKESIALAQATPFPTPAVSPVSPLYGGVMRVSVMPPPYAQTATVTTGSPGAALSLQIPIVVGFTTLLYGFDLSCTAPSVTETGVLTISNIRGQPLTYNFTESTDAGTFLTPKIGPLENAGGSTGTAPIALSVGAVSGGSVCALNAYYGFKD